MKRYLEWNDGPENDISGGSIPLGMGGRIRSQGTIMTRFVKIMLVSASALCSFTRGAADSVTSMHIAFWSINVYSATVILDNGVYKMWYGGWESPGQWNDAIYYRTSADGVTWSNSQTVVVPGRVLAGAVDANDPTVTKHYNAISKQYQYTMFYTLCVAPCDGDHPSNNQTWSAVSSDGVFWQYHKPLMTTNGASEPSAIITGPQQDGTFWQVYYMDVAGTNKQVSMANVSGDRTVLKTRVVYTTHQTLANPEVRQIGGNWVLFTNVYTPQGRADIYNIQSNSNLSWAGALQPVVVNNGPAICATYAPGVLPLTGNAYAMYFGNTHTNPSTSGCSSSQSTSMQAWTLQLLNASVPGLKH